MTSLLNTSLYFFSFEYQSSTNLESSLVINDAVAA
jgi:hypothetical protein